MEEQEPPQEALNPFESSINGDEHTKAVWLRCLGIFPVVEYSCFTAIAIGFTVLLHPLAFILIGMSVFGIVRSGLWAYRRVWLENRGIAYPRPMSKLTDFGGSVILGLLFCVTWPICFVAVCIPVSMGSSFMMSGPSSSSGVASVILLSLVFLGAAAVASWLTYLAIRTTLPPIQEKHV